MSSIAKSPISFSELNFVLKWDFEKLFFTQSLAHEKLFRWLNNGLDWFIYEKYSDELKGIHIIFHTLSLSPICLGKDISSKMIITTFWKESKDGGNPWGGFTTCKAGWLRVRMMHFYSCKQHWPHLHYSRLYSIPLHLLSPFIKSPMYEIDPKMPSEHRENPHQRSELLKGAFNFSCIIPSIRRLGRPPRTI